MDKEFFEKSEIDCYTKLVKFNDNVLKLNDLGQTPTKYHTDASGITATSRYFNLELKNRNQTIKQDESSEYYIEGTTSTGKQYTANTIFIEQHKVCSMLLDYITYNQEPIYINFLNNGIVVFNLAKLKTRPETEHKKIHSKGYGKIEIGDREGLSLKDATIYDNNYNLIKRPD